METDVGGAGNKQFNIPAAAAAASNVDRIYHGYQYTHNPYEEDMGGMDLGGANPMYVPSYNMYQHHANLKLGSQLAAAQEQQYQTAQGHGGGGGGGAYAGGGYNAGGSGYVQYGVPETGYGYSAEKSIKKKNSGTALSALTLLAFLFFLNLLQSCLKEHINTMNPTVLVMTAGSRHGNMQIDRMDYEEEDAEDRENAYGRSKQIKSANFTTKSRYGENERSGTDKRWSRVGGAREGKEAF